MNHKPCKQIPVSSFKSLISNSAQNLLADQNISKVNKILVTTSSQQDIQLQQQSSYPPQPLLHLPIQNNFNPNEVQHLPNDSLKSTDKGIHLVIKPTLEKHSNGHSSEFAFLMGLDGAGSTEEETNVDLSQIMSTVNTSLHSSSNTELSIPNVQFLSSATMQQSDVHEVPTEQVVLIPQHIVTDTLDNSDNLKVLYPTPLYSVGTDVNTFLQNEVKVPHNINSLSKCTIRKLPNTTSSVITSNSMLNAMLEQGTTATSRFKNDTTKFTLNKTSSTTVDEVSSNNLFKFTNNKVNSMPAACVEDEDSAINIYANDSTCHDVTESSLQNTNVLKTPFLSNDTTYHLHSTAEDLNNSDDILIQNKFNESYSSESNMIKVNFIDINDSLTSLYNNNNFSATSSLFTTSNTTSIPQNTNLSQPLCTTNITKTQSNTEADSMMVNYYMQQSYMSLDGKECSRRSGDILLSELQTREDSNLDLVDNMHVSLNATLGDGKFMSDMTAAQEISNSHLINNISQDFVPGNCKTTSSNQVSEAVQVVVPTLPSTSSTSDMTSFSPHLMDNSIMGGEMNSFPEGDFAFNLPVSLFGSDSNEKTSTKRNLSQYSTDLNFTDILKDITIKPEPDFAKLKNATASFSKLPRQNYTNSQLETMDSLMDTANKSSEPTLLDTVNFKNTESTVTRVQVCHASQSSVETKVESTPIKETLVQHVSCLRCSLCSFLSEDKKAMNKHMSDCHFNVLISRDDSHNKEMIKAENSGKKIVSAKRQILNKDAEIGKIKLTKKSNSNNKTKQQSSHSNNKPEQKMKPELKSLNNIKLELSEGNFAASTSVINQVTPKSEQLRETNKVEVFPSRSNDTNRGTSDSNGYACGTNGCTIRMNKEENLAYHRKCHVNSMLMCPECDNKKQTFSRWVNLAMHLWKVHIIDMELHKCPKCTYRSYSYCKLMNVHFKTHGSDRPYLCDICGRNFKTVKALHTHKRIHIHRSANMVDCKLCHRTMCDRRMLESHMETVHKKVKPFLCNYCGKAFASKSTLGLHIRIHTGEKPFSCNVCQYRTSDHNSLRRHNMKHTNSKRYCCPYCDYSSIQSATYKAHLTSKHRQLAINNNLMFACEFCSYKTIKRDNFLTHAAKHKDEKKNPDIPLQTSSHLVVENDNKQMQYVSYTPSSQINTSTQNDSTNPVFTNVYGQVVVHPSGDLILSNPAVFAQLITNLVPLNVSTSSCGETLEPQDVNADVLNAMIEDTKTNSPSKQQKM